MLFLKRRDFLKLMSAGAFSAPFANPLFTLAQSAGDTSGKTLIVLNLEGGVDHLALFPYLNDPNAAAGQSGFVGELEARRPTTWRVPNSALMANGYIGFHSGFAGLHPEFQNGKIALIQSIGISPGLHPGGSHNTCQNVYSYANQNYQATSKAWFADFIDKNELSRSYAFGTLGRADFSTARQDLTPLVAEKDSDLAFSDPFGASRQAVNFDFSKRFLAAAQRPPTMEQEKVLNALKRSVPIMEYMAQVVATPIIGAYPGTSTGNTFKSIARCLKRLVLDGDLRARLFYACRSGFDSHAGQGPSLDASIQDVGASLTQLVRDLKAMNIYDKTIIIAISEFARTAWENGGGGTDHGWGTTLFALGGPVNGGVRGEPPQLSYMLERNECRALIDFRNLLKESLDWMGLATRADAIISPDLYTRVNLNLFSA